MNINLYINILIITTILKSISSIILGSTQVRKAETYDMSDVIGGIVNILLIGWILLT